MRKARDFKRSKHVLNDAVREFQATGSEQSAETIILSVLLTAYSEVSWLRHVADPDDLIQTISVAILKAARKFDTDSRFYPHSYLVISAVHAVYSYVRLNKPGAVPIDINDKLVEKYLAHEPGFQDEAHGKHFIDSFCRSVLPWLRSKFPQKQVEIYQYRMGLKTGTPETLEAVARRFGNSRQYINVIEKKITEGVKRHIFSN